MYMALWRKKLWKINVVDLGETLKWIFFHKIVRVLKFLFKNLARFKIFSLKSDMLQNFWLKI